MQKIVKKAVVANIQPVTEFVEDILNEKGCSMKTVMQINIALDEILGNIANYGYKDEPGDFAVTVDFDENPPQVILTFEDSGIKYDPLAKDDPDVTLSAEERKIGGLGIFMVKKSMDDMHYEYKEGKNILTLIKRL